MAALVTLSTVTNSEDVIRSVLRHNGLEVEDVNQKKLVQSTI